MSKFKLISNYTPIAEQKLAIEKLSSGIDGGVKSQVLLGVTGSGKTFTVANIIEKLQIPTLIISHNKTLAAQLYQEFKSFFPENAVSYFVSYYDYYQPESYIPQTDTYIEKDAGINEMIDKLRLLSTTNLLTRNDNIVVSSVSCIYNLGSPKEYGNFIIDLKKGKDIERSSLLEKLIDLQYERNQFGFSRGTFRVRGDVIDIYPAYMDDGIRLTFVGTKIKLISLINTLTGQVKEKDMKSFVLYPAKHYMTDPYKNKGIFDEIYKDMTIVEKNFKKQKKLVEAQRIRKRVTYDLEMIKETGYVKGIENYSRYFDGRGAGDAPYSLLEYFKESYGDKWLVVVDESHMTIPQVRGMYNGDFARKKTLIDYGFRLPAAFDNRPLRFEEFVRRVPTLLSTSATPSSWEMSYSNENYAKIFPKPYKTNKPGIVEQLLRPTGIPDPEIKILPTNSQVEVTIKTIEKLALHKKRSLVTTLTKKTAEDLTQFLKNRGIKVQYLHSDVKTLERSDILDDLRSGNYDAIIGVNLLREGLDLPEVAEVLILDADKEGFLRSEVALIQTMGRAARHIDGEVTLFADTITNSIKNAIAEVERRRKYQLKMNKKYNIKPKSIKKPIREKIFTDEDKKRFGIEEPQDKNILPEIDYESLTPLDKKRLMSTLRKEMLIAAKDLNFELAAELRDRIRKLIA